MPLSALLPTADTPGESGARDRMAMREGGGLMGRRVLEVEIESAHCVFVRGYGSRSLLMQLMNNKPPLWSRRARAWVCAEHTARTAIAAAEHAGWDVVITGPCETAQAGIPTSAPSEQPDPGAGLW